MIESYPLSWPEGWKRTPGTMRRAGQFNRRETVHRSPRWPGDSAGSYTKKRWLTVADGVQRILAELGRMGLDRGDVIVSTNVPTRLDGMPRSGAAEPADPGAAVYWRAQGEPTRCMAIDRYTTVADNLAAIAATLEAMRAIERHGGAEILDRAFRGFQALPQKATSPWRDVLGFNSGPVTREAVQQRFREMARQHHPDTGGDAERFMEVTAARDQALAEVSE